MDWIDGNDILSNWNASDDTPCSWNGVFCDTQFKLVTKLNLSNANISGNLTATPLHGLTEWYEMVTLSSPGNILDCCRLTIFKGHLL